MNRFGAMLTTGRKITGGFAAALIVVLVIGIVSFSETLRFGRSSAMVSHTYQVLDRLSAINNSLHEAESYQRGYLLTGDASFLGRKRAVQARSTADLSHLRQLVLDNPVQRPRVDELQKLVERRISYLDRTVAVRDSGDLAAMRDRIAAIEAEELTVGVRTEIALISGEELNLLERRNVLLNNSSIRVRVVILVGSLFAFLLVAIAGFMIRRDLDQRTRAEGEMLKAKDAAEKANRAKSDFLALMSHELRTPLNSVIGFSNVLLKNKDGSLGEQNMTYLRRIQANGKHLLGLINDILDLSKIEAGRVEIHNQRLDLAQLIAETIAETEPRTDEKNLALVTKIPPLLTNIITDPARLKQVLINLVSNAIKFTEAGSVTVSVIADEYNVPLRIDVTDTGRGIREDRREAIFAAFEQEDVTITREFGGTGLGLAISRALCQRLGYGLEMETKLGHGSTFKIVLARPTEARDAVGTGQHRVLRERRRAPRTKELGRFHRDTLQGCTVLVIDDERDARVLLHLLLDEFGVSVVQSDSGEDGLQVARDVKPDLITLDLKLPGMSGAEVLRTLKEDPELRDIPVIVVSANATANRKALAGAAAFIDKPATREETIELVARHIHHSGRYVLVVDDDADARELFRLAAESNGAKVRTADSGRAALTELDRRTPSLMILDIGMDHLDGLELLHVMRSDPRFETLPVVVVTGMDLSATEQASLRGNALAVLRKNGEMDARLQQILQTSFGRT